MAFGLLFYLSLIEDADVAEYFRYVYVKYQHVMYHGAMSILNNHQLAEDAVHDAFFKLASKDDRIRQLMKLKYTDEEGYFLVMVCKQCAINVKNSAAVKHEETSDLEEDIKEKYYNNPNFAVEENFGEEDDNRQAIREMVLALEKINEEDRSLIMMLFYKEYTLEQIIEDTGWDRQTVYVKKSRALKRLRKAISDIRQKGVFKNEQQ